MQVNKRTKQSTMIPDFHKIAASVLKIFNFHQLLVMRKNNKTQLPLLSKSEILDLLHRVQNKKRTRAHKLDISHRRIGDTRSIYRGYGLDYEESRQYLAGDDLRYMNWQLTARTGKHYMKVFREERQPGVFIVIDRRVSMRFGTQQRLKVTQAVRAAAIAAFTAQQNNLSVGGLILDQDFEWFKETQSKHAIFNFIQQASQPVPAIFELSDTKEPDFNDVLKTLNEVLTGSIGSYIYLISDFYDLDEQSRPALLELATTHQIQAIQITDNAEINLPDVGSIKFKSGNSKDSILLNTHSRNERDRYETAADIHLSLKKKLFENLAISYQEILTSSQNIEQEVIF